MKSIVIAAFYKFVSLPEFETMRVPILKKMQEIGILGTIILAHEGVNGSFAGSREQMDSFYEFMHSYCPEFVDLNFKETFDPVNPFEKSKVKLRKEIVTMGISAVQPACDPATYLTPEQWNEMIKDPDVIVLDTRNDYEFELGTFKNAINPDIENFREFPDYVERELLDKKDKKIAMFCTGGIRCEKTTTYLKEQGFEHVYQLHNGILNYIEAMPQEESTWEGSCFVFDDRVAVDQHLTRVYPQLPQDYKDERYPK